nr:uncharacterized protein LOC118877804 [Drosophila suzukii]
MGLAARSAALTFLGKCSKEIGATMKTTKGAAVDIVRSPGIYCMYCLGKRVTLELAFTSSRSRGSESDDLDLRGRLDFAGDGAQTVTAARVRPPAIVESVFRLPSCGDPMDFKSTRNRSATAGKHMLHTAGLASRTDLHPGPVKPNRTHARLSTLRPPHCSVSHTKDSTLFIASKWL